MNVVVNVAIRAAQVVILALLGLVAMLAVSGMDARTPLAVATAHAQEAEWTEATPSAERESFVQQEHIYHVALLPASDPTVYTQATSHPNNVVLYAEQRFTDRFGEPMGLALPIRIRREDELPAGAQCDPEAREMAVRRTLDRMDADVDAYYAAHPEATQTVEDWQAYAELEGALVETTYGC